LCATNNTLYSCMLQSKFVQILRTLSTDDIKALALFMRSPYFNKDAKLVILCDYIFQYAPDYTHPNLSVEIAFPLLFPEEKYSDTLAKNRRHKLWQLIQQFVLHHKYMTGSHELRSQIDFLDHCALFSNADIDKIFEQKSNEIDKMMQTEPRIRQYFYDRFIFEHLKTFKDAEWQKKMKTEALQHALNCFYSYNTLHLLIVNLNYAVINKQSLVVNAKETHFLADLQTADFYQEPVLELLYYLVQFMLQPDELNYYTLDALIAQKREFIAEFDINTARTLQNNYCIIQIRMGDDRLYKPYIEHALEKYSISKTLSIQELRNIITIGIAVYGTAWASTFLENAQNNITPPEMAADAYIHNTAKIKYHAGEYDETISLLLQSKVRNLFYNIESRILTIKSLCTQIERQKYAFVAPTGLDLAVKAMKAYLNAQKKENTLPEHGSIYLKFVAYMLSVCEILNDLPEKALTRLQRLLQKIEDEQINGQKTAEYKWLTNFLKQLQL
jgi:hypothetical protein